MPNPDPKELFREKKLAEAIDRLSSEVKEFRGDIGRVLAWFKSQAELSTKLDLILTRIQKLEDTFMASQAEVTAQLRGARDQLIKAVTEIKGVQTAVDELKVKVTELEAVIAQGGAVDQELIDAANEVKAQADVVDNLIPDAPVVPPPVV